MMTSRLLEFSRRHGLFDGQKHVLCALSGGADSVALLLCMLEMADTLGLAVSAAHYNHRLRGAESDRDESFCRQLCRELGVELYAGSGDVRGAAASSGEGVEAAARCMRYEFLESALARAGGGVIATAHHAGDNAETVLLNLTRGAGLTGLSGIPPKRGHIVRPMLGVSKAQILEYLESRGRSFVTDSTNLEGDCRRNRLRLEVVPLLERENPAFTESASAAALRLREDDEYLLSLARERLKNAVSISGGVVIPAADISSAPGPLRVRMLRLLTGRLGFEHGPSSAQTEAVLAVCAGADPSARVSLGGGLCARRVYDMLELGFFNEAPRRIDPRQLNVPGVTELVEAGARIGCELVDDYSPRRGELAVKYPAEGGLTVRAREAGDAIRLIGGTKTLKKLFIDMKIPRDRRGLVPVIADGGGAIAVCGLVSEDRRAKKGDKAVIIRFSDI